MFPPNVIDAVKKHMNVDHAEESLLICQTLGGQPEATEAEMAGMDDESIEFSAIVEGHPVSVRVSWYEPVVEREDIRMQVVRMYRDACARAGVTPREEEAGRRHE